MALSDEDTVWFEIINSQKLTVPLNLPFSIELERYSIVNEHGRKEAAAGSTSVQAHNMNYFKHGQRLHLTEAVKHGQRLHLTEAVKHKYPYRLKLTGSDSLGNEFIATNTIKLTKTRLVDQSRPVHLNTFHIRFVGNVVTEENDDIDMVS